MLMQYLTHTYLSESVVEINLNVFMTLHCIIVEVKIEIDEGTCWGQQLNKREGADTSVSGRESHPMKATAWSLFMSFTITLHISTILTIIN